MIKLKCTRITQCMAYDYQRDVDGNIEKTEKGVPVYKQMPRWDICFEIIGEHRRLSGSFQLNTTNILWAKDYVLGGVYEFSDITPVVPTPDGA